MIPLVTLVQAKSHLLVVTDREDEEIYRKTLQATGIVIDYLKHRAHTTATVATSSVANPTVITTTSAHRMMSGQIVTLDGHAGSTPALDGTYVVSSTTTTTFTVPVDVTVAGTGGTAMVEWTPDTAPQQVIAAVLLMLTHLYEHRGAVAAGDADVWRAIERLLVRSRDPALA